MPCCSWPAGTITPPVSLCPLLSLQAMTAGMGQAGLDLEQASHRRATPLVPTPTHGTCCWTLD